jgi:hypothetical protein
MTDAEKIERAINQIQRAENTEVARQQNPAQHERNPPQYQKQQEREGRSEWSGGSWGGRSR